MPSKQEAKASNNIKLRPSIRSFWAAWLFFMVAALAALIPGGLLEVLATAFPQEFQGMSAEDWQSARFWTFVVGVSAATGIGGRYIAYPLLANRYIISDDRLVEVYGVIKKERKTTKLEHIVTVNEDIGYIGRILGFGDLVFFTAGSGGEDLRLSNIDKPQEMAAEIQARADAASEGDSQAKNGPTDNAAIENAVQARLEPFRDVLAQHEARIARLYERLDEATESQYRLREQLAIFKWRLNNGGSEEERGEPPVTPEPTTPDVTSQDKPEFKGGGHEPVPVLKDCSTSIAPSSERPPVRNPAHTEDGELKFPQAEFEQDCTVVPEEEFTGLMAPRRSIPDPSTGQG